MVCAWRRRADVLMLSSLEIPCTTPVPMLEGDELSSGGGGYDAVGIMGHYVSLVGIRYVILRYMLSFTYFLKPFPLDTPWLIL